MEKIEYNLQVSKQLPYTELDLKDLETFARGINKHGISCAIYFVSKRIVLMRNIETSDTILEWRDGKQVKVLLRNAKYYKLAEKGVMEKRKMYKEYRVIPPKPKKRQVKRKKRNTNIKKTFDKKNLV